MSGTYSTLFDPLRLRAKVDPRKTAYTFLRDGETVETSLTYTQLDRQARAIAARLQGMAAPGERALLLYHASLDFIAAFFGCLYAGVVAVPTYPPRRNRPDVRFEAVAEDAKPSLVLTTRGILAGIEARSAKASTLENLNWLTTDGPDLEASSDWKVPDIDGDTLAFLQYTSGSIGSPKGVMLSHGNLLHNLANLNSEWGHTPESVMVTWLPVFHDMGLIYGVLEPL